MGKPILIKREELTHHDVEITDKDWQLIGEEIMRQCGNEPEKDAIREIANHLLDHKLN